MSEIAAGVRRDMGFLKQTGKKKKKDQKSYTGELVAEPKELMSEGSGLEKRCFFRRRSGWALGEGAESTVHRRTVKIAGIPA